MKILDTRKKEFLQWTVEQDRQRHINASDAELEELYGTPKRSNRPMEDWDRYKELSQSK